MHEAVRGLIAGDGPVTVPMWHALWDSLADEASAAVGRDAVALLEAMRERPPDHDTAGALVQSLAERRPHPPPQEAVNIVGSGGGPSTFNLSTLAALVAAAVGVRVVKSGSRGYTSRYGSIDALKLLGVPLAGSDAEVADALERFGIAFAGPFVHPPELARLARQIFPRDWRELATFINALGPFLAAVPATSQVTGVADHRLLALYEHLAANHLGRRLWMCFNGAGIDELVSFEQNIVQRDDGTRLRLDPSRLGAARGSVADLRPAADAEGVVRQFTALLAGEGPAAAIDSICLNAACMVVASDATATWKQAFDEARDAVGGGAALTLLERLRREGAARPPAVRARRPPATVPAGAPYG